MLARIFGNRVLRAPIDEVRRELDEYFEGRRRDFDLPLDLRVIPFNAEVLGQLARVPYGTTTTYGALAAKVGRPGAARAIGTVMNRNPIPIVLPCHRVIGANGSLTGYGGRPRPQAAPAATRGRDPGVTRVVVVGGGFAGLLAVRGLRKADVEVTLVDRQNFHLFQPLAYQVATGALSAAEIATPLRQILRRQRNARVLLAEVTGFDLAAQTVSLDYIPSGERNATLEYDRLVVAGGSAYSYFGHDDWAEHAPELKSLTGALDLRSRILSAFEAAEVERRPGRPRSVADVRGRRRRPDRASRWPGRSRSSHATRCTATTASPTRAARRCCWSRRPTGCSARFPRRSRAAPRSHSPPWGRRRCSTRRSSESTRSRSRSARPTARPRASLRATPSGRRVSRPPHSPGCSRRRRAAETDRAGRLLVEPDLTLPGHPDVFALGDMVAVRDQPLPGVAPVAMQEGRHVARSISRGRSTPFRYRDKGNLATIGRSRAIADIKGLHFSGLPAWLLWLGLHLFYLIGFQNRLLVLTRWTFSYVTRGRGARLIHD